jgi:hypothetical protein
MAFPNDIEVVVVQYLQSAQPSLGSEVCGAAARVDIVANDTTAYRSSAPALHRAA